MDCDVSDSPAVCTEELMVRYQQADTAAASALVDCLSSPPSRFFSRYSRTRSSAADMLQDVWLRIHQVRHTYRPGSPLLPWVYAIAHRVRIDNYRKLRRRNQEVLVAVVPDAAIQTPREVDLEVARTVVSFIGRATLCVDDAQDRRPEYRGGCSYYPIHDRCNQAESAPCVRAAPEDYARCTRRRRP